MARKGVVVLDCVLIVVVVLVVVVVECVLLMGMEMDNLCEWKQFSWALQYTLDGHNSLDFGDKIMGLSVLESLCYALSLSCFEFSHL